MPYDAQLRFLQSVFKKYHLQTTLIDPHAPADAQTDYGIKLLLDGKDRFAKATHGHIDPVKHNTLYKLTDPFSYTYLFLLLPKNVPERMLIVGPYAAREVTPTQLFETAERCGLDPKQANLFRNYYSNVPTNIDNKFVYAMIVTLAEQIWGGSDAFTFVDVNQAVFDAASLFAIKDTPTDAQRNWIHMQSMEQRYAMENELMEAVANGRNEPFELMFAGFSHLTMEQRLTDPVRNLKNYCIILNTLLRKAAERGGVHPMYLDKLSSKFAHEIERVPSIRAAERLMHDMFDTYCKLVKQHSIQKYSPPVQKAVLYIESDLTADLRLSRLAELQNISAGYLSARFKKETGQTVTEFVNKKRAERAANLLKTTNLQVQTIAQHCGMVDVHYFSKMFKKHYGMTPKEYRESK